MVDRKQIHLKSSDQLSQDEYSSMKVKLTEQKLKELYKD